MEFTLKTYIIILHTLQSRGNIFLTFKNFIESFPRGKDNHSKIHTSVIFRHDVDRIPSNALKMAKLEHSLGVKGTYYFRVVPAAYDEKIIKAIADLGHEIGYHYEDLALANGDLELGIRSFEKNLERLRRIVPVKTICMHGSPLSKFDNRLLWQKFDYRKYGIIGEPYLDIDFNEVLYLTDTGRRWDGDGVSVRDRVTEARGAWRIAHSGENELHSTRNPQPATLQKPRLHNTFDIINALEQGLLPDKIMLTIHPQRWHDRLIPWAKELVWQNAKNVVKAVVVKRRNGVVE